MSSNKRRLDGTRSGDEVVQVLESASAELRHAVSALGGHLQNKIEKPFKLTSDLTEETASTV